MKRVLHIWRAYSREMALNVKVDAISQKSIVEVTFTFSSVPIFQTKILKKKRSEFYNLITK